MSRCAAIIGGGVIGGGWAARFLLNGWDVTIFDPDPDAKRKIYAVLDNARHALPALYERALPDEGRLQFCDRLEEAVAQADWIQESVPERLQLKHAMHEQIAKFAKQDAIIGSSTSGFKPSDLNRHGDRIIVSHPFNPVYLLPLVELVGTRARCEQAADILRAIGMYPLMLRREVDAHIADRLLEAVWRESLWLVKDGIATTEDIDEAIRMGFGLRWAQMGLFETYRIAGGEAGMKHFLAQFGPALQWPWTKLTDVPDFTDDLVNLIATQSDQQSGDRSIRALERERDNNLVGILRALKQSNAGAGKIIKAHEASMPNPISEGLPITFAGQVPPSWADYNGHMNEAHYLEAASKASDRFMELIGADAAYVAKGKSYFTVESHIRYLAETHIGEQMQITTQLLDGTGKRLHLFHHLKNQNGTSIAEVETLLLHVDLSSRRTCLPEIKIEQALAAIAHTQQGLPVPKTAGLGIKVT